MKGKFLLGLGIFGFLVAVFAVGYYLWTHRDSVEPLVQQVEPAEPPHWNAQFEEHCVPIQGVQQCTFAEPEPFQGQTFHLVLPGGQPVPAAVQTVSDATQTPFQPVPGEAVTPTVALMADMTYWTTVNPSGCTCRNRNEFGDPTTDLQCTDGTAIAAGTSMSVYCTSPEVQFYFKQIR